MGVSVLGTAAALPDAACVALLWASRCGGRRARCDRTLRAEAALPVLRAPAVPSLHLLAPSASPVQTQSGALPWAVLFVIFVSGLWTDRPPAGPPLCP